MVILLVPLLGLDAMAKLELLIELCMVLKSVGDEEDFLDLLEVLAAEEAFGSSAYSGKEDDDEEQNDGVSSNDPSTTVDLFLDATSRLAAVVSALTSSIDSLS